VTTGKKKPSPYGRARRRHPPASGHREEGPPFHPRINPQLRPVLREVGVPEDRPFEADPFQVEALERLESGDVVVSAPTGSGKTYIAVEAMAALLARGGRIWYASPLKALSNAKFIEFGQRFGSEAVGLLTGDHKVNPDAPIIVGTTEILRNQLYDAMSRGGDLASDLVVMDEAHYLGDPDRGVVWEEVIIYLPSRVRLLLLSATIDNAREIAEWLTSIRGGRARVVVSTERPVPLYPLFLLPDGELIPLDKGRMLSPQIRHYMTRHPARGARGRESQPSYGRILRVLGQANLLPAIFFLKSRSDCDLALPRSFAAVEYLDPEARSKLEWRLDDLLERYPFLKTHPHLKYILGPGVAAHHAGHMPHWKLVVEHLMQEGLLNAIFSTSTVAAGVNFPARTVVICQSDRFNGREFIDLTATELMQMTGRAGRRGKDRIGFALIVPGPFQNPGLIHDLFKASPEPVLSQIQITFSMVLNLLMSYRPDQLKVLLDRSLAAFQQGRSKAARRETRLEESLADLVDGGACGGPDQAMELFGRYGRLDEEARRLERMRPRVAWETALRAGLSLGRLFEVYGGQRFCALGLEERRGRPGVSAAKLREDLGLKKGQVRQKWVPLGRISGLFETRLDLAPETPPAETVLMIRVAATMAHEYLDPERLAEDHESGPLAELVTRQADIRERIESLPCHGCPIHPDCLGSRESEAFAAMLKLSAFADDAASSRRGLWSAFRRHLDFLVLEGFVTPEGELTEDGRWSAQLRLDHPLPIAAGIRARAWPEEDPVLLAAMVAPYVVDKERDSNSAGDPARRAPETLANAWLALERAVMPLVQRLARAGFDTPRPALPAALAIHAWAAGEEWETSVDAYGQDPGDMAMLVYRTADNLRQIANLRQTHPELAATAKKAAALIMKPPVLVPL